MKMEKILENITWWDRWPGDYLLPPVAGRYSSYWDGAAGCATIHRSRTGKITSLVIQTIGGTISIGRGTVLFYSRTDFADPLGNFCWSGLEKFRSELTTGLSLAYGDRGTRYVNIPSSADRLFSAPLLLGSSPCSRKSRWSITVDRQTYFFRTREQLRIASRDTR